MIIGGLQYNTIYIFDKDKKVIAYIDDKGDGQHIINKKYSIAAEYDDPITEQFVLEDIERRRRKQIALNRHKVGN